MATAFCASRPGKLLYLRMAKKQQAATKQQRKQIKIPELTKPENTSIFSGLKFLGASIKNSST
jgi:hypothetical protein